MKYIKTLLLSVLFFGVTAPSFAVSPFVKAAEEVLQEQPQTTDILASQTYLAFQYSTEKFTSDLNASMLTDEEKIIFSTLCDENFVNSLKKMSEDIQNFVQGKDKETREKGFAALRENKYIKEMLPLFANNQKRITEYDKDLFDTMIIRYVLTVAAFQGKVLEAIEGYEDEPEGTAI